MRRNSLFKLQARYVSERQDPALWAKVLTDDNRYRRQHIDQVSAVPRPAWTGIAVCRLAARGGKPMPSEHFEAACQVQNDMWRLRGLAHLPQAVVKSGQSEAAAWHTRELPFNYAGGVNGAAGEQEPRAGQRGGQGLHGGQPAGGAHRAAGEDRTAVLLLLQQPQPAGQPLAFTCPSVTDWSMLWDQRSA